MHKTGLYEERIALGGLGSVHIQHLLRDLPKSAQALLVQSEAAQRPTADIELLDMTHIASPVLFNFHRAAALRELKRRNLFQRTRALDTTTPSGGVKSSGDVVKVRFQWHAELFNDHSISSSSCTKVSDLVA